MNSPPTDVIRGKASAKRRIVNHVMSSNTHSNIFSHFIKHLDTGESNRHYITSTTPIEAANIYHYHRPNLESVLPSQSVATVHHDLSDDADFLDIEKFINAYKQCNTVVCLNKSQERILAKYGISNTVVIPHGADNGFFEISNNTHPSGSGKVRLGFLSRRYGRKVKGEAYLYQLFENLSPNIFEFIFVGQDRTEDAWRAREYGFAAKVYERMPYRLFPNLYKEIDILLVLSKFEGGPACIPEAIASGTPILSTKVGMAIDHILEGKNGYFLTEDLSKDAEIFSKISNPEYLGILKSESEKMRSNAIRWQQVASRYEKIYASIWS